jgi:hypothetical protein
LTVIINGAVQPAATHLTAICEAYIKVYVAIALEIDVVVCYYQKHTISNTQNPAHAAPFFHIKSPVYPRPCFIYVNTIITSIATYNRTFLQFFLAVNHELSIHSNNWLETSVDPNC